MADLKRRIIAEFSAKNKAKGEMAGFRSDMDKTGRSMKRMAGQALAMAGIGGGFFGVKRGLDYVTKAAMKQEDALFLLEAALRATGEYSFGTMKKYEAFAASIQQATVYGDEEVLALMQLMKSLGVTSNALEQATKMAIGLAAATGRDVTSMSMYIALAKQGEFTMLRRYIPALRSTTDATEQLRIITEFAARGFKIAEAQAETASGSFAQMGNAVSDLAEIIGGPLADAMAENARGMTKYMKQHEAWFARYIADMKEGTDMWWNFWKAVAGYTPGALIYKAITKPEEKIPEIPKPRGIPEVIRFEEPEWLKATLALNVMTEAHKKAGASIYEMSMKAKGLGEELAREKKITQFAALAKVRYGADVAGAQAAQERFIKTLSDVTQQKAAEEIDKVWTEMWLKQEEKAYHAMRAPIIAAEKLAEESAERRKRIAEDIALSMASSWSAAIDSMMFEGAKFWDAMKDMAQSLLHEITRIIIYKQIAEPLAYGIMGLPVPGYQHGGVATRPHLAKVGEVPEAIVPLSGGRSIPVEMRGGGGGNLDVHVHNEGSEKLEISAVEEYAVSDQRIIDVTMRAAETHGPYRRSIKQIR